MLRLILDICGVFFIAEVIIVATIAALAWNVRRENENRWERWAKRQNSE